jgi:hypothetical protein
MTAQGRMSRSLSGLAALRIFAAAMLLAAVLPGAASAQNGYVQYGVVSTGPPAYVAGTNQPVSLDLNGNMRVVIAGGITVGTVGQGTPGVTPWVVQDSTDGPVTPGTAAAKSGLIGGIFNSAPPTLTNGQQAALQTDSSGRLIVNVGAGGGTGGTSSNFAAAFPGIGTAIGFSQGGNFVAATGTSGNLNVACISGCNASSDTSNGAVTPGSAGTTSKLAGGVFNTAPATLSNTQQAAIQLDNKGNQLVNINTPLPAGANVIGQVGGTTATVTATPTVTAAAYSTGFCIGGLMTFTGAARSGGPGSGLVQSAVITDVSGQDSPIDLVLFSANPTASSFVDHAACAINNADLPKVIATIPVSDCHLLGTTAPGMCQGQQQAVPYTLGGGNTTIWAVNIARGTPTYAGTGNIADRLALLQD